MTRQAVVRGRALARVGVLVGDPTANTAIFVGAGAVVGLLGSILLHASPVLGLIIGGFAGFGAEMLDERWSIT